MVKRNSIFVKVLVPVIIVMLIQTLLISMVLFVNGTIASLNDNAIETLKKNVEYRAVTLETTMYRILLSLDTLENDITAAITKYLEANDISINNALGNYEHETNMLRGISKALLSTLRQNSSTGMYMYFIASDAYSETEQRFNGLYYRNLNPIIIASDNSDILFLRGFVDTARKDNIQLDSLWNEVFIFSPDNANIWRDYSMPLLAARDNPSLSPANLSYWNTPHLINPKSQVDSNECVTYTRPYFYNGKLIAMLGTEIQTDQLKKFFPSNDYDNSDKSGYMLIKYHTDNDLNPVINCDISVITGSYIKRMLGSDSTLTLVADKRSKIYTIESSDESSKQLEPVHIAIEPLRLYNDYTPFSNEQWALASIGADSTLFNYSNSVTSGILISSIIALGFGIIVLYVIIRISTKPLISIVDQIKVSDSLDPIISKSNTYEIALLSSSINAMKNKRRGIEMELRAERERYLIALENAADTFLEYDIATDSFMLYYFTENQKDNKKPELFSKTTESFIQKVESGLICHTDDISNFVHFLTAEHTDSLEIRAKASELIQFTDDESDEGYFWLLIKASSISNDDGKIIKHIGIARNITQQKLEEKARIEASLHDSTTGLYNRDYGLKLIKKRIHSDLEKGQPFSICLFKVNGLDMFEAYYGRVFSAAVIMRLSLPLLRITTGDDVSVRLNNDMFIVFFANSAQNEIRGRIEQINAGLAAAYMGENTDLRLSLSIGAVVSENSADYDIYLRKAFIAALHAMKTGSDLVFYNELTSDTRNDLSLIADTSYTENPINVSLDLSKESIVSLVFDLFEHTTDIKSVINILLRILGELFSLQQIIICSYDADFCADQVTYQWNVKGIAPYHTAIEKLTSGDLKELELLLNEDGVMEYNSDELRNCGDGVKSLLCLHPDEIVNLYCCMMYETGVHIGRVIFKSGEISNAWDEADKYSLYEISKIISAHISIEKSNTASRAKSEFLSRMSHEIRTPMNAIIGITRIAKDNINNPEQLSDYLEKIDFAAKHLLSLINDVLDMSRIESGKLTIINEPFFLTDLAATLDMLMRRQIENNGLSFVINMKNTHNSVIGDEYRLRQVIVNLLSNASKFTDPNGYVSLLIEEIEETEEAEVREKEIDKQDETAAIKTDEFGVFRFSVKDNGIGISKDDQLLVFEAFEQAEFGKSIRSRSGGTGLGLAICSRLVGAMGGKIDLYSDIGKGSEFSFSLRLAIDDKNIEPAAQNKIEIDYTNYFTGRRVLLVEDNEINIEIASYILEEAGLTIEIAKNGQEAIDMFFASPVNYYNVIMMDIQMPVMDGLTATRQIRKNTARPDAVTIPILAMTANAFDEDMKKSIESGMNGHIAKPIDTVKLYTVLSQLI